jgi:hypothetical protein
MPIESRVGWSEILRALAHEDRRELFQYLNQVTEARIEDVEHHLLHRANEPSEENRSSIRLMLYHVHIPMLRDTGLLSWDPQDERVHLTALGSQLPAELIFPNLTDARDTDEREPATE